MRNDPRRTVLSLIVFDHADRKKAVLGITAATLRDAAQTRIRDKLAKRL